MTEAQKKKLRMDRMKAAASKDAKVKEDQGGKPFDPGDGVDATLAGNKDLFDAVPDIDATGMPAPAKVPGDELGTQDTSTAPNIPMDKTDAKQWNTSGAAPAEKAAKQEKWSVISKKEEKLNFRKLMSGGYIKKIKG
jgi:hypothetical protein